MHNQIQSNPPFDTAVPAPFSLCVQISECRAIKKHFLINAGKGKPNEAPMQAKGAKETEQ